MSQNALTLLKIDSILKQALTARDALQEAALADLVMFLDRGDRRIVLAASPAAGKTEMSFIFIERFLERFPKARVLYLPHGTTVLCDKVMDRLNGKAVKFTYAEYLPKDSVDLNSVSTYRPWTSLTEQVIVSLPQTLMTVKEPLGVFDLVVCDESHERVLFRKGRKKSEDDSKDYAKQHSKILKQIGDPIELYLTGSPFNFHLYNEDPNDDYRDDLEPEGKSEKLDLNKRWYAVIVNEDEEYEVYSAIPSGPKGLTLLDLLGLFKNSNEAAEKIFALQHLDALLYPERAFHDGSNDDDF